MPESQILRAASLVMALALSACSSFSSEKSVVGIFSPYRFDRVQGNVVTREQIDALKAGMTRAQVKDILGTPLMPTVFRGDRWDYTFTFVRQGAPAQLRRLTVYFQDDVMLRFDADDVPTEDNFVASLKTKRTVEKLPKLVATQESLEPFAPKPKPEADLPPPALDDYPPLESPKN